MKNHENQPWTMKTRPGTMINHEKPTSNHEKPTWSHEKPWKPIWNHKINLEPWKTMKTDQEPWKTNLEPWKNHDNPPRTMKNQTGTMKNHFRRGRGGRAGINKNVTNRTFLLYIDGHKKSRGFRIDCFLCFAKLHQHWFWIFFAKVVIERGRYEVRNILVEVSSFFVWEKYPNQVYTSYER